MSDRQPLTKQNRRFSIDIDDLLTDTEQLLRMGLDSHKTGSSNHSDPSFLGGDNSSDKIHTINNDTNSKNTIVGNSLNTHATKIDNASQRATSATYVKMFYKGH